ncbi:hypothetical protein LCGC14_0458250 [marine sediment metagenome]|uniref:Uncharacterized protein n=1 Tax=marine sediment metagenome TaxID=412755 RepID=A0A0F9SYX0_9ZZZZ
MPDNDKNDKNDKVVRSAGLAEGTSIDATLAQGGVWQTMVFTVPLSTPEDRVQAAGAKYRNIFGSLLEDRGKRDKDDTKVLGMRGPTRVKQMESTSTFAQGLIDPTRKKYCVWAFVTRRPTALHMDIPDALVPAAQEMGMQPTE